jgi:prevent-host-death family protein
MVMMTMMSIMKRMSIAEAKARFADAVKRAEGGDPVVVTRYGSDVAVIIPVSELAELKRLRAAKAAGGLAVLAGGWEGSAELGANAEAVQRSRTRAR